MSSPRELADALDAYAGNGACCLGLVPGGKSPAGPWAHGEWDYRRLMGYLSSQPGAGIGVICGARSGGLLVIDVDVHGTDGRGSLRDFIAQRGPLPETTMVLTPSGGCHLWYRVPDGVAVPRNATAPSLGMDVRGEGGYVAAPPTELPNGAYRFAEGRSLAEAGVAVADERVMGLAELIRASAGAGAPRASGAAPVSAVREGGRNEATFRYACHVRAMGGDERDVLLMATLFNQVVCSPPLGIDEVRAVAESACRYDRGENTYALAAGLPDVSHPKWEGEK